MFKKCQISYCNKEAFENIDRCLFHCEKNDWYKEENGKQTWNELWVDRFWKEVRNEKMSKKDYYFDSFVFPFFQMGFTGKSTRRGYWEYGNNQTFWETKQKKIFFGRVDFTRVRFLADTSFREVTFSQDVFFKDVYFFRQTSFDSSRFLKCTWFENFSKFGKSVSFWGTKFSKKIYFDETDFLDNVDFYYTKFLDTVRFSDVTFDKEVAFIGTDFQKDVSFDKVKFSEKYTTLFDASGIEKKQRMFSHLTTFSDIIFPQNVIFRGVNLAPVLFERSKIDTINFLQCSWNQWVSDSNRTSNRNKIANEYNLVSLKNTKHEDYEEVENIYRQLKRNFEDKKDWVMAGDFHMGEMAMREKRLQLKASERWRKYSVLGKVVLFFWYPERWKLIPERMFLKLYETLSLYGERVGRPFFLLIAVLIVFAVLIQLTSYSIYNWSESLLISLRAISLQRADDFLNFPTIVQWLVTIEFLFSVILIPLFLLALQRRFKR